MYGVELILSDHLGSTSMTTDDKGVKVSEMRYKPWGEVRYAWTNDTLNANPAYALTKYTFTGQYSHMDDPSTPASEGFGLMYYNARMYDPALGRFTSADTIVPGGVQGYDRYAYVNNSPVNYVDPSGHESVCGQGNSDPECGNLGNSPLSHPKPKTPPPPGNEGKEKGCKIYGECLIGPPAPVQNPVLTLPNPIENYCGNTSTLSCLSMVTQDATTLIDLVGVGLIEAPLVALGCLDAGWPGCAAGELVAAGVWSSTLGNLDIGLSWLSTGFTIADDLVNNGGIGENTITSVSASIAGMMAPTPSADLIIDGYAAGYNHGIFNGVNAIFNGSSIFSWVK
ncbi:MAG: RHS repeat-associated core domain-containing protein [Chloroflexi bacterium]|nr:RHS repeat-associated core domain-containing protein [Chloroflexota bacterium]